MNLQQLINRDVPAGIYIVKTSKSADEIGSKITEAGLAFYYLDGNNISNRYQLVEEVKRLVGLPKFIWASWDSFYDGLAGFNYTPADAKGYTIFFDNFEAFAKKSPNDFHVALQVIYDSAKFIEHNSKLYLLLRGNQSLIGKDFSNLERIII